MSLIDQPISQPSFDSSHIWTPVIAAEVRKLQLRPVRVIWENYVFMFVLRDTSYQYWFHFLSGPVWYLEMFVCLHLLLNTSYIYMHIYFCLIS
jgi:hypothetical protein